ncbi:palladin isoform X1 [Xiphophorus couchianus]|uniref:palladin isoform X1 n=2 Tax=Xiphophorus couchianus TaxID=32473 RepID=UPI001015E1F3|nr:palladin-like isoform X1 [Xiphophorus couchianus]XP_027864375.1 palladin-like isoform X1 [Xiphophorus couchianus]XP_027864378.1 palladin-like isoform X1 [Xiphophorus couchianus]
MDSNVTQMQKKTSTMSLTISSSPSSREHSSSSSSSSSTLLAQRHSSLVHPLCVSPQRMQSPVYNQQYSGKGVPPTFVKCLHDMSTVKGQLVVLECRLRGTPPLQVMWYREDEQIQDSDDFRILRKKGSSASVPEELCTLVITEAFPEDSGLFKCVVLNSYGTVSCSATLEVYNDLEEQLEVEAIRQQEAQSLSQEDSEAEHHQETTSFGRSIEGFPPVLPDCMNLPPPEWPDSPLEDSIHGADLPDPEPASLSIEEPLGRSEEESALSSEGQRSPDVSVRVCTPSPPPLPSPPAQVKEKSQTPKLFTPSKLSFTSSQSGGNNMNLSDLPSFTPGAFPPSAFNYERPRHFIQSQAAFQAPSYESVLREAQENQNNQQNLSSTQSSANVAEGQMKASHTQSFSQAQSVSKSVSQTQSQFQSLSLSQNQTRSVAPGQIQTQANGTAKSSPSSSSLNSATTPASSAAPPFSSSTSLLPPSTSSSSLPRATMRSTITLTPRVPSASGLGSASLPANQDTLSASAAYLCSVLPSPSSSFSSKLSPSSSLPHASTSPSCSPLAPTSPLLPMSTSASTSSLPLQPLPVSPSLPRCPSSSSLPQMNNQSRVQPTVVSLPADYKGTPNTLPKPILKKSVAPRPSSSRSTDEDIQGSKDALIQDLEKKLRSKEARRRHSQKLSYEERMARRLLGPDNATYMLDQDNFSDLQLDQSESPEGRRTGGLWARHHSGTDERSNEGSAIQEKCFAPRFLQIPPDLTVEEGRFCRIDFKVSGLPAPDISWYLDDKAIRPDDYHKMLVCEKGMHSFIIEIVTVHHAGVYECVAKNRAGEGRFTMRLDVIAQEALRPPTFIQKMLNTRALEGDTVRLECKVDASPPPQLFWKKDKDMLRVDPNRMSLYQDGSGRQCLLIDRVTKSDSGWYTLSAINEAGMSTCNARLDVGTRTTPAFKTAPPASKTLKLLSSLSHVPALTAESPAQHTAPLYESEEL